MRFATNNGFQLFLYGVLKFSRTELLFEIYARALIGFFQHFELLKTRNRKITSLYKEMPS